MTTPKHEHAYINYRASLDSTKFADARISAVD